MESETEGKRTRGFTVGNQASKGRGRPPKPKYPTTSQEQLSQLWATHLKKAQEGDADSAVFILEYERFIAGK